tara:strand:+ start:3769 stop:4311 length:543 start_codon:yes stop_codon:yes gene_type:complete
MSWTQHFSQTYQKPYFYNSITKKSVWKIPDDDVDNKIDKSKVDDEKTEDDSIPQKNDKNNSKNRLIQRTKLLRERRKKKQAEDRKKSNQIINHVHELSNSLQKMDIKPDVKIEKNKEKDKEKSLNKPIISKKIIHKDSSDDEILAVNNNGMACSIKGRTHDEQMESLRDLNEAYRDMYRR